MRESENQKEGEWEKSKEHLSVPSSDYHLENSWENSKGNVKEPKRDYRLEKRWENKKANDWASSLENSKEAESVTSKEHPMGCRSAPHSDYYSEFD